MQLVTGAHCGVVDVSTSRKVGAGLLEAACRCFRRSTVLSPKEARPWIGLGLCEASPVVAQHALLKGIEKGGGGVALCNLGLLCIQLAKFDSAQQVLLQAQCDDPSNEAMWAGLGMIYDQVCGKCYGIVVRPCLPQWSHVRQDGGCCFLLLQSGASVKACAAYLNSCELFSVPEPLIAVAIADLAQAKAPAAIPALLQVCSSGNDELWCLPLGFYWYVRQRCLSRRP